MKDLLHTETIVAMTCPTNNCGVLYGLSSSYIDQRRNDHDVWSCPNGHTLHFAQKNELEEAKAQLRRAKEDAAWYAERAEAARRSAEAARRSAAATRGHLTRLRNKIALGICPCCRRNFGNVAAHMQGQHADWLEAKGIEL